MSKLFIGRLPNGFNQVDLEEEFKKFGKIKKLDVKTNFAFVEYEEQRDASDAIRDMNGKDFQGSAIIVQEARGPRDNNNRISKSKYRIVVEGLADRTSWQDLKDFAREAGKPVYSDVSKRGGEKIGIIEYETGADMDNALRKLHDTELHGSRVRLYEDTGRDNHRDDDRRGGRDDYRGRDDRGRDDRDYGRGGGYDGRDNRRGGDRDRRSRSGSRGRGGGRRDDGRDYRGGSGYNGGGGGREEYDGRRGGSARGGRRSSSRSR